MQGHFAHHLRRIALATVIVVGPFLSVPPTAGAQTRSATIRVSAYVMTDGVLSIASPNAAEIAQVSAEHGVEWSDRTGSVFRVSAPRFSDVTVVVQALDGPATRESSVEVRVCQDTTARQTRCQVSSLAAGDDLRLTSHGRSRQWMRIDPAAQFEDPPQVRLTVAYMQ